MVAIGQWLPRFVLSSFGLALNLTSRLIPRSDRTPAGCPTIESLIREKGYPFETHEVTTEDGYLIDVHRIPYGRNKTCGYGNESGMVECGSLGPIFVMTGLLADSASLVLDFPGQSLGFVLADSGYDVWLGNTRGNTFGRRHQTLSVGSRQFWNFSFEEHAFYDLPAQIDYILNETANRQLFFIGISQGTLTFFAMMSEKPEYNAKVKAFAGLAPFYKLANIAVPPLAIFGPYIERPLVVPNKPAASDVHAPKQGLKPVKPNNKYYLTSTLLFI
ncbi:lipase member M-like [Haemaphysalis longicornis]